MQDPRGPALLLSRDRQGSSPAIKIFMDFAKTKMDQEEDFSEALAMVAYLVATASNVSKDAAVYCEEEGATVICEALAGHEDPLCRQWGIITLAITRSAVTEADSQWSSEPSKTLQDLIRAAAGDEVADVRASALFAMFSLFQVTLRQPASESSRHMILELTAYVAKSIRQDGSGIIRNMFLELTRLALRSWSGVCEIVGWLYAIEDDQAGDAGVSAEICAEREELLAAMEVWLSQMGDRRTCYEQRLIFVREIYIALTDFTKDPDPVVRQTCKSILRTIMTRLMRSELIGAFPTCGSRIVDQSNGLSAFHPQRRPSDCLKGLFEVLTLQQTILNRPIESGRDSKGLVNLVAAIAAQTADGDDGFWARDQDPNVIDPPPLTYHGAGFAEHRLPALEDWVEVSARYFHQPRLRWDDRVETTTATRLNLREQNGEDSAIVMAADLERSFSHRWYTLTSEASACLMAFHSYEPILAVAGEHTIEIWQTVDQRCITRFNPSLKRQLTQRSPIKSMTFLNEQDELDQFTLMVALCNGVVKVFHGEFDGEGGKDLLRATAAFRSLETSYQDMPVVTTWSQVRNELTIASGSSNYFQIWDAQQQICTRTMPIHRTRPESVITCLSVEPERGNIFLTGDSAGVVTMYDRRQRRQNAVKWWEDRNSRSISLCHPGAGLEKEIVSVS